MPYDFHLPYLISYSPLVIEDIAVFCVAILTAILVSAEGQGFAATLLGDARADAKDRLHFNVFMHMSIPGTLNFFVGGFGWAKNVEIDTTNFKSAPRLRLILTRLAGPIANLLLGNIAASINWLLGRYGVEDKVFSAIVVVNVSMAVYNLLLIPPLPGSAVVYSLLPQRQWAERLKRILDLGCPYLLLAVFLLIRICGWDGVANIFNPVIQRLSGFILVG